MQLHGLRRKRWFLQEGRGVEKSGSIVLALTPLKSILRISLSYLIVDYSETANVYTLTSSFNKRVHCIGTNTTNVHSENYITFHGLLGQSFNKMMGQPRIPVTKLSKIWRMWHQHSQGRMNSRHKVRTVTR